MKHSWRFDIFLHNFLLFKKSFLKNSKNYENNIFNVEVTKVARLPYYWMKFDRENFFSLIPKSHFHSNFIYWIFFNDTNDSKFNISDTLDLNYEINSMRTLFIEVFQNKQLCVPISLKFWSYLKFNNSCIVGLNIATPPWFATTPWHGAPWLISTWHNKPNKLHKQATFLNRWIWSLPWKVHMLLIVVPRLLKLRLVNLEVNSRLLKHINVQNHVKNW
jgi:hypothetical protein